ncbi:MAG: pre-peptidase C-terminal domain-containing protein [Myxococcales bacterium]|nr:pre-peptidase C-terminal domain-containing protein [Myxococcales bacterium]
MLELVSLRSTLNKAATAALCVGLLVGCKADAPGSKTATPVTDPDLAPPRAETATETPLNTVVIQGTAVSRKVLLRANGSGLSQVVATDFDGIFCAEFPLDDEASDTYAVYAVDDDGEISRPTTLTVAQVAAAPQPEVTACNDAPICKEEEVCEGDLDADCDGNKGACDTDCNGCSDDYFEPNDAPFSPPQVTPGTYALDVCPCNMDYFTIPMVKNQTYTVTVTFDKTAIDLDLYFWTQANAEAQNTTYAAKSVSTAATETFTYKATADGNYVLKVHVFDGTLGNEAPYTLKIQ